MTQHKKHIYFFVHITVLDWYVGCRGNSPSLSYSKVQVLFILCLCHPPRALSSPDRKRERAGVCMGSFHRPGQESATYVSTDFTLARTLSFLTTKEYEMSFAVYPGRRNRFWWTSDQFWCKDVASNKRGALPSRTLQFGEDYGKHTTKCWIITDALKKIKKENVMVILGEKAYFQWGRCLSELRHK